MPGPSTDAFMQVRWALLDPAHDKAVTERVLRGIEEDVSKLSEFAAQAEAAATAQILKVRQLNGTIKDWESQYNNVCKAYNKAYEYQAKANNLKYWLEDCTPITWAERMASW